MGASGVPKEWERNVAGECQCDRGLLQPGYVVPLLGFNGCMSMPPNCIVTWADA